MKDRSRGFRILVEKRWREQLLLSGWRSHSEWFRPVKKRRERVKRVRLSLRFPPSWRYKRRDGCLRPRAYTRHKRLGDELPRRA